MKATAVSNRNSYAHRHQAPRYPNCPSRRITVDKVVDVLLSAAITLGCVVILVALFALA